jgi:tryptophan halogenase
MPIPDTLADKLELFRRRGRVVKYREGVFLDASWIAVYLGQGIVPEGHDLRADAPPAKSIVDGMRQLRDEIRGTVERMPSHREHVDRYCPMAKVA